MIERVLRGSIAILLAATLSATPAARADQATDDADALESCLTTAWPRDVLGLCIGVIANPCQAEPGNETTEAIGACLRREADAWDAVLGRLWPRLVMRSKEVDAANGSTDPETAAGTLLEAERAWVVFRDAECRYAYASWGDGSFRLVAHAACRLDLTARRVVDIYARLVKEG